MLHIVTFTAQMFLNVRTNTVENAGSCFAHDFQLFAVSFFQSLFKSLSPGMSQKLLL